MHSNGTEEYFWVLLLDWVHWNLYIRCFSRYRVEFLRPWCTVFIHISTWRIISKKYKQSEPPGCFVSVPSFPPVIKSGVTRELKGIFCFILNHSPWYRQPGRGMECFWKLSCLHTQSHYTECFKWGGGGRKKIIGRKAWKEGYYGSRTSQQMRSWLL